MDALLAAIAEGDRGAHTDPHLKQELEVAETAIGQLQVQYATASATEEQCRKVEARLDELNASIQLTERLALDNNVILPRLLDDSDTLEEVYMLRSFLDIWRILEALDDLGDNLDKTQTIETTLSTLSLRVDSLKAFTADAEQVEADCRLLIEREQSALRSSAEFVNRFEEQTSKLTRIKHERDTALEQLRSTGLLSGQQTAAAMNKARAALARLSSLITQISAAVEVSVAIATRERIAENQSALRSRYDRIRQEVALANRLINELTQTEKTAGEQFFHKLGPAVGMLFDHMQVNRVLKNLGISAVKGSFRLDGELDDGVSLDPGSYFSQGQKQDLALSMFLVRAASLGGSFFLDEPLVHLDDLNRTALLDCLRACVLGTASSPRPVRLVVTTANWSVARHLMQKFYSVRRPVAGPWLRVIQLSGNVRQGLSQSIVFPTGQENTETLLH